MDLIDDRVFHHRVHHRPKIHNGIWKIGIVMPEQIFDHPLPVLTLVLQTLLILHNSTGDVHLNEQIPIDFHKSRNLCFQFKILMAEDHQVQHPSYLIEQNQAAEINNNLRY